VLGKLLNQDHGSSTVRGSLVTLYYLGADKNHIQVSGAGAHQGLWILVDCNSSETTLASCLSRLSFSTSVDIDYVVVVVTLINWLLRRPL
jgi:hypothetical protein